MQLRDHQEWSESEEAILVISFQNGVSLVELSDRHLRSLNLIEEKLIEMGWVSTQANDEKLDYIEHDALINSEPFINDDSFLNNDYDGPDIQIDESDEEADEEATEIVVYAQDTFTTNKEVIQEYLNKYSFEETRKMFPDFDEEKLFSDVEYALKFNDYTREISRGESFKILTMSEVENLGALSTCGYGWCLVDGENNVEAGPFNTIARANRAYASKYMYVDRNYEYNERGAGIVIMWGKSEKRLWEKFR